MTQEDIELLLTDLCARLRYDVIVEVDDCDLPGSYTLRGYEFGWFVVEGRHYDIDEIKPYLRPMSSMTFEEQKDLDKATSFSYLGKEAYYDVELKQITARIDWLNSHHFDYRGLIKKGLALEAPEGMYEKF